MAIKTMTIKAQLPSPTLFYVPRNTPIQTLSTHADTPIGRRNAEDALRKLDAERKKLARYGGANYKAWIEYDGRKISAWQILGYGLDRLL